MKNGTLIALDHSNRRLSKAHAFLEDPARLLSDPAGGVEILLDALPYADTPTLLKIIPLLGYAGRDRVLWPIYRLMEDPHGSEQVRNLTAIQLGLAASLSDDPSALNQTLIDNLDHPDASLRIASALALGWQGNHAAVNALFIHLNDTDEDVQAALVTALASIGEIPIFERLKKRLNTADMELARSILLNLWRFSDIGDRVTDIYLEWMQVAPDHLHPDILSGLSMLPLSPGILDLYNGLLAGDCPRIKKQIISHLLANEPIDFVALRPRLVELLNDSDDTVRQTAIRLHRFFIKPR
jgi:hypothetical protein